MATSIEPSVTSWAEKQINALDWQHGPQQNGRELDARVDEALKKAKTKSGGEGINKPDHVLILDNGVVRIPVLCEWKGSKGALRDKKAVALRSDDGYLRYGTKGIDKYASLGAAYYASRVVGPGGHERALALAINGYYKAATDAVPTYEIALYVVANDDTEKVMWVGDYSNLDVLDKKNFPALLQEIEDALDPLAAKLRKQHKAESLDAALKRLNEFLHDQHGIVPSHRVNVIAALMIASLGVTQDDNQVLVKPLVDADLYGGSGNDSDGSIILSKVENYLSQRTPKLPADKQTSVLDTLRPTLLDKSLSAKASTGMSALKAAFHIVSHGLLPHYHDDRAIDFAGRLFNEMYAWIDVPDAGLNDVVLTPKRTTDLMVELTQIDSDSYVWDWTLGTGAFLVSSMNVMLADAREKYQGQALRHKENKIKVDQLLGIEKLSSVYVLAVLNMILMGDGSSNIIHGDSHAFDGRYQQREDGSKDFFPATTLVLNPPYSAPGKGLIFVKEAFAKMNERGTGKFGAVIIQDSAGSGAASDYCIDILKHSSLVASIKMPSDLFIGKAGVQTSIYVFNVGSPHKSNTLVKFIDFRNDGYKRSNRKKAKDPSTNLRPVDNPDGRYAEVAALVTGRKRDTDYYSLGELYFEDTIDPASGNDWNFDQHVKLDTKPNLDDFRKTVADYVAWEVDQLLKSGELPKAESQQTQDDLLAFESRHGVMRWDKFPLGGPNGVFENPSVKRLKETFNKDTDTARVRNDEFSLPLVNAKTGSNGIMFWGREDDWQKSSMCLGVVSNGAVATGDVYPHPYDVGVLWDGYLLKPRAAVTREILVYLSAVVFKTIKRKFSWENKAVWSKVQRERISLPVSMSGEIAWDYMCDVIRTLESERVRTLESYLVANGLSDCALSKREQDVMEEFKTKAFEEYIVGGENGLFSIAPTKPVDKALPSNSWCPVVSNTSQSNGIKAFEMVESNNDSNVITFSDTTDSIYTVFYQKSRFAGYSHVQAMTPVTYDLGEETALFFIAAFRRAIGTRFNWGAKFNRKIAASLAVQLPSTSEGKPDYEFMEVFIGAVKKMAAKSLVEHLQNSVTTTEDLMVGV